MTTHIHGGSKEAAAFWLEGWRRRWRMTVGPEADCVWRKLAKAEYRYRVANDFDLFGIAHRSDLDSRCGDKEERGE